MEQVLHELDLCILCNKCLEHCPLYAKNFSVQLLNKATRTENPVSSLIQKFTFSCMQCRQCVPVCPMHLHRDEMMLILKHKIRDRRPWKYRRYTLIRGPGLPMLRNFFQKLFIFKKKSLDREFASYMETNTHDMRSLLFYPGCYVYSTKTMRQTIRLLNHVGTPYGIVAGISHCCGIPYYLQGEFQRAEICLSNLYQQLIKGNPQTIISGCNECLEALHLVNKYYDTSFKILSIVDYLMDHIDSFPNIQLDIITTLHDACRYQRNNKDSSAARNALRCFSNFKEMPHLKENAFCCAHWNYEFSQQNVQIRKKRLDEAKKIGATMACECLTCYEEYRKQKSDVQVIDILDVFEQSLLAEKKT